VVVLDDGLFAGAHDDAIDVLVRVRRGVNPAHRRLDQAGRLAEADATPHELPLGIHEGHRSPPRANQQRRFFQHAL